MPIFKQCCCCCSLQTGGIVLGILGAIRSVIGIALSSLVLFFLDDVVDQVKADREAKGKTMDLPDGLNSDDATDIAKLVIKIILWVFLIICVVDFCAAILLVIGAKRSRKQYILPYLITDGMGIIVSTLYFVIAAFNGPQIAQGLVSAVITLLISGYLWLCVLSLYQWIKETSRPPTTVRSPYPEQQAVYSTMA
ncbi:uncharacterized protein LOC129800698 isoform X1 [Phlebotomus papatasi]|uniref:uncharacterized protein LOC129800698 isoform X1 n=1 Tax=Phlebotomus papatasi TaxID=29031 RepID=UPI002483B538|nr:uncharacterized protein LOC129800698 isoform X1 [Phlebotomus papatasi]XP_055701265.1 uncharacterized protein LOC129800698 isoform X1 [Phlebotomus papatasi]